MICEYFRGTLDEFAGEVAKTYEDGNAHRIEYDREIAIMRLIKEASNALGNCRDSTS